MDAAQVASRQVDLPQVARLFGMRPPVERLHPGPTGPQQGDGALGRRLLGRLGRLPLPGQLVQRRDRQPVRLVPRLDRDRLDLGSGRRPLPMLTATEPGRRTASGYIETTCRIASSAAFRPGIEFQLRQLPRSSPKPKEQVPRPLVREPSIVATRGPSAGQVELRVAGLKPLARTTAAANSWSGDAAATIENLRVGRPVPREQRRPQSIQ